MKLLKYILSFSIVCFALSSCDDESNENIGRGESINEFNLVGPSNFAEITLNPGTPTKTVTVSWQPAKTGLGGVPTYRFLMDEKGGDFSSPVLAIDANDDGKATDASVTVADLLAAVGTGGEFIWTAEAKTTTDQGVNTVRAKEFALIVGVSSVGISEFEYVAPSPNQKLLLDGIRTPNDDIVFSWSPATSENGEVTYHWVAATSPDGFEEPVLTFQSDNGGMSPTFTRTHEEWIELLDGVSYTDGIYWRVEASVNDFAYAPEQRFVWFEIFDVPTLYIVGSFTNGWSNNCTDAIQLDNKGNGVFESLINIPENSEFKLVLACGSWDVNWGSPIDDAVTSGEEYEFGGGNIKVAEAGSYFVRADFSAGIFRLTKFDPPTDMFLVGGSTSADWNPGNSVKFVEPSTNVFEIYTYMTVSGGGLKFLQVQDWAGDWGSKPGTRSVNNGVISGTMVQDGEDNATIDEDGFYRITLDFNTMEYKIEPIAWGVIGSARTGDDGGWGADDDMQFVGGKGSYTWTITTTLFNGQLKFRANDDWGINFGDAGANGTLEYGADNLNITAGTYKIDLVLDPIAGYTYTITPQ